MWHHTSILDGTGCRVFLKQGSAKPFWEKMWNKFAAILKYRENL
jgi:hypothetical protein